MNIQQQVQAALNTLEQKVEAKLTAWGVFLGGKLTEIYKALQKLWDLQNALDARVSAVETMIGAIPSVTPTVSRGTYEMTDAANLALPALPVGESYSLQDVITASMALNNLTPETGTYAFKLLGGSIPYTDVNNAAQLFDTNDTMYVTFDTVTGSTTAKVIAQDELSINLTVGDIDAADPNVSATLSADFLEALI